MKTRLFLIFGIFVFSVFVFSITTIPFLIAVNHSGNAEDFIDNRDCLEDYSGQFDTDGLVSGSVKLKEGCKTDLSRLVGDKLKISVEEGATLEKNSDTFVLTSSGIVEIGDPPQRFDLEGGGKIEFKEDGNITQYLYTSQIGEHHNLGALSLTTPKKGKVNFNVEEGSLSLPDEAIVDVDDKEFTEKFLEIGLKLKGNNFEMSKDFAGKMFGGASEDFRTDITGEMKIEVAVKSKKDLSSKYFMTISKETGPVSFDNVGVNIEPFIGETTIVFGGGKQSFTSRAGITYLGDSDYFLPKGGVSYISLGKDSIYLENRDLRQADKLSSLGFSLKEGSNIAGFNLGPGESFSLSVPFGEVSIQENEINIKKSSHFTPIVISNGEDGFTIPPAEFYPGRVDNNGIYHGIGKKGSLGTSWRIKSTPSDIYGKRFLNIYGEKSTGLLSTISFANSEEVIKNPMEGIRPQVLVFKENQVVKYSKAKFVSGRGYAFDSAKTFGAYAAKRRAIR